MNILKISLLLFCSLFLNFSSFAQSDTKNSAKQETERALEAIEAIKEGTIVIVLATNAKKISSMISTLRSKNMNPNLKNRLKDQLFETVVKTKRQNEYLMEYYSKYYTFSDLRFAFDTSAVELKKGNISNVFVDQELQIDETIQLDKPIGGFIRIGRADNLGTGALGMLICDSKNKVLDNPFPYNVILPDGDSPESEKANFEKAIERTCNRLEKFYTSKRVELNGY